MATIIEVTDDNLYFLEETIKENVEWLYTSEDDEIECIGVENLEVILSKFLGKQVILQQR
jgi:hypothetical protein